MATVLSGLRLVTADDVVSDAVLVLDGDRIVGVRRGSPPADALDLGAPW